MQLAYVVFRGWNHYLLWLQRKQKCNFVAFCDPTESTLQCGHVAQGCRIVSV